MHRKVEPRLPARGGVSLLTLLRANETLRRDTPRVLGAGPTGVQVGLWRPWVWAARRR